MSEAIADCIGHGSEPLIEGLSLPDVGDRHVLAAAIEANAQVIVTANLSDFPPDNLAPFGIEAKHPDDFVLDLIDLAPAKVALVVSEQASASRTRHARSATCWPRCRSRASCRASPSRASCWGRLTWSEAKPRMCRPCS